MACFHPLTAHRERGTSKPMIGFPAGYQAMERLELPCGRCIGCIKDHARAWSIRIGNEASLYACNLFLTLDYSPENLQSWSLEYGDWQSFMRRLRKKVSGYSVAPNGKRPVRFFVSGEYGAQFGRPHWHAILFNCAFPDMVSYTNGTFQSKIAEELWEKGRVIIGSVTPRSAAYVAGYTLQKVRGPSAEEHYEDVVNMQTGELFRRRAEFSQPSRKPGIGAWFYERYKADMFPHDFSVVDGKKFKVPRYYWNKFKDEAKSNVVEDIEYARFLRSRAIDPSENSDGRRSVREEAAWSRSRVFETRGF